MEDFSNTLWISQRAWTLPSQIYEKSFKIYLSGSNKFIKDDQLKHARQRSRKDRAHDVFMRDMDRSDPVMLSYIEDLLEERRIKNKHDVPAEVLALMKDPLPGEVDQEEGVPVPANVEPEVVEEEGFLLDILNAS